MPPRRSATPPPGDRTPHPHCLHCGPLAGTGTLSSRASRLLHRLQSDGRQRQCRRTLLPGRGSLRGPDGPPLFRDGGLYTTDFSYLIPRALFFWSELYHRLNQTDDLKAAPILAGAKVVWRDETQAESGNGYNAVLRLHEDMAEADYLKRGDAKALLHWLEALEADEEFARLMEEVMTRSRSDLRLP